MAGTSLISNQQKQTVKDIIDDIHATFAREITVYEEGEKVLIAASPQYNGVYGRTGSGEKSVSRTVVKHTMMARIKYIDTKNPDLIFNKVKSQINVGLIDGTVRITVDEGGYNIIKEAKRCEFEGRRYTIDSKGTATGMFGPQYYHFYLKPTDE